MWGLKLSNRQSGKKEEEQEIKTRKLEFERSRVGRVGLVDCGVRKGQIECRWQMAREWERTVGNRLFPRNWAHLPNRKSGHARLWHGGE